VSMVSPSLFFPPCAEAIFSIILISAGSAPRSVPAAPTTSACFASCPDLP